MKEEWLFPGAVVPVDVETTAALVVEIKRLIDVVGGMALMQPAQRKPLTDDEIKEIFLRALGDLAVRIPPGWRKVVNAIEAAHGIKENT